MFIAAFACSVFLLARDKNALRFTSKDLLCGLLIGVMNAVSNLFMLKCLDVLSVNSVMLSVPASNMLIAPIIGQGKTEHTYMDYFGADRYQPDSHKLAPEKRYPNSAKAAPL